MSAKILIYDLYGQVTENAGVAQGIRPSLAFIHWNGERRRNLSLFSLRSVPFYLSLSFLQYKIQQETISLYACYYFPNFPWHLRQQNLQKKKRNSFAPSEEEEEEEI